MELKAFVGISRDVLENMDDSEVRSLSDIEKIERYLIIDGIVDHEFARKIELIDARAIGADSMSFTIVSTKKRCKNPYVAHYFVLDQIHGHMNMIGYDYL